MHVGRTDPELAFRETHRRTAVTTPTGLMEHQRPVGLGKAAEQIPRSLTQAHFFDDHDQKNPSLFGL
ncbi:hypothetical protein GCM10029976_064190 [Kribbella albertanoniae]